jgi:hypothetical protein
MEIEKRLLERAAELDKQARTFNVTELRVDVEEGEEEAPKIRGHLAVFRSLSEDLGGFREMIAPGAFAKTLREADVRALYNHDPNFVLGRNTSGTLQMVEDDDGLFVDIDPPGTQWARDLMVSIKRGDVSQGSFRFRAVKDIWEKQDDGTVLRVLNEVRLYDVSVVTFPAYADTDAYVRQEPSTPHSKMPTARHRMRY